MEQEFNHDVSKAIEHQASMQRISPDKCYITSSDYFVFYPANKLKWRNEPVFPGTANDEIALGITIDFNNEEILDRLKQSSFFPFMSVYSDGINNYYYLNAGNDLDKLYSAVVELATAVYQQESCLYGPFMVNLIPSKSRKKKSSGCSIAIIVVIALISLLIVGYLYISDTSYDTYEEESTESTEGDSYNSIPSWIIGDWRLDTPYGDEIVHFKSDGNCRMVDSYGTHYGTFYISDNTIYINYDDDPSVTYIEIQGHSLHAGEGYYYHKQ